MGNPWIAKRPPPKAITAEDDFVTPISRLWTKLVLRPLSRRSMHQTHQCDWWLSNRTHNPLNRIRPESQNSFIQTIALPAAGLPAFAGREPIYFPLLNRAEIDSRYTSMAVHRPEFDLVGPPS